MSRAPPTPCSDMWVCQVVIALKGVAQPTAMHSQKEIKPAPALKLVETPPTEIGNWNVHKGAHLRESHTCSRS